MPTTQSPIVETITGSAPCLYLALELSGREWRLAFTDGACRRPRHRKIPAVDAVRAVPVEVALAKAKLGLPDEAAVKTVYEAAWDGFWVHRMLEGLGYESVVIDPSSLQVDRRRLHAKTDRLDVTRLVGDLVRHHRGERIWRVVWVPSVQDEDARRPHRERSQLMKEALSLGNRIRALLGTYGVRTARYDELVEKLDSLTTWDGEPLPQRLSEEVGRMSRRLRVVKEQLKEVEAGIAETLAERRSEAGRQAVLLQQLRAVSGRSGLVLATEVFAWRRIRNRRQLGALAGLVGVPYDSGGTRHDQGISKAGNKRVRTLMIELAWLWLRYQPGSALSVWFQERFGKGSKRSRRVGIVALARKLLVAFWQFVEHGVVPTGAQLRAG